MESFICEKIGDHAEWENISDVKSSDDFAAALEPWLHALADVRPDLFDKIVREIALAKGIRLPPNLRVVSDSLVNG